MRSSGGMPGRRRAEAEHAQALDREHRPAVAAPPVEAAHAREVLRAREARLAALELGARARRAQQVAQRPASRLHWVDLTKKSVAPAS
jgi:hypothetical protein